MNIIENEKVILRDFTESDIPKRMYWETEATEWQLWDGPWEYEGKSKEELQEEQQEFLELLKKRAATPLSDEQLRTRFEIVDKETSEHVGWIGSYHIDEECLIRDEGTRLAIGITLPEVSVRGKGLGLSALSLAIDYFFQNGYDEIYTQTWSGNNPMQAIAAKLGFEEIRRKKDFRLVRGERYDGLTFCKKRESIMWNTAAYCGLACKSCSVYIASCAGGEKLEQRAKKSGMTAEEMYCKGCRSDKTSPFCTACEMKKCIRKKKLTWCSECEEYPCEKLKDFQNSLPHRAEIMKSLDYAKDHTIEEWEEQMKADFACETCGTYHSVYEGGCINCGNEYANAFSKRHWDIIKDHNERKYV